MRDELKPYIGEPEDQVERDELEHFEFCPRCQSAFDRRDLAAVFYHFEPHTEPPPVEDAERLLRIGEQLRAALGRSDGECR